MYKIKLSAQSQFATQYAHTYTPNLPVHYKNYWLLPSYIQTTAYTDANKTATYINKTQNRD
jgi:hypothetical protein